MNVIHMLSTQSWAERLGLALIHFLWEGALIAGVYAIARSMPGRAQRAEFRYLLACAALAAMGIAPVATFAILSRLLKNPF